MFATLTLSRSSVSGFGAFLPDNPVKKEMTTFEKCMKTPLYFYIQYFPRIKPNWTSFNEAFQKDFGSIGNASFQIMHRVAGTHIYTLKWDHSLKSEEEYIKTINIIQSPRLHFDTFVQFVEITDVDFPKSMLDIDFLMQSSYYSDNRICFSASPLNTYIGEITENCLYRFLGSTSTIERQNLRLSIIYKRGYWTRDETLLQCNEFYFSGDCPSGVTMDISGELYGAAETLTVMRADNTSYQLNATQYLPLGNGTFRICSEESYNSDQQKSSYPWTTLLAKMDFYTSTCLSAFSLIFEVLFVGVFHWLKDIQYQTYDNIAILNYLILIADSLSIASKMIDQTTKWLTVLKILAVLQHFNFLCANTWSAVSSIDLAKKIWHHRRQEDNTQSRFNKWKKLVICILVNFLLVALCIALDQSKIYEFQYGESDNLDVFWIKNHYPRVFFYLLPAALCYVMALCSILVAFGRLKRMKNSQSEEKNTNHSNLRISLSTMLKIITILVIPEIFGSVQMYKSNLNENEAILNSSFAYMCSLTRSVRGIAIFMVCFCNRKTRSL